MNKLSRLFLFFILFFSCGKIEHLEDRYVCSCEERENVKEFVNSNIKNANNMSDEEMEDVIDRLFYTGLKLNCSQKPIRYNADYTVILTKMKPCEFVMKTY